jgi:hypothetical protein
MAQDVHRNLGFVDVGDLQFERSVSQPLAACSGCHSSRLTHWAACGLKTSVAQWRLAPA